MYKVGDVYEEDGNKYEVIDVEINEHEDNSVTVKITSKLLN